MAAEWRGPGGFARFLAHAGPKPSPQHSIDRYPNKDGNYEPGNVRWATVAEQNRNKRGNRLITYNGETLVLNDWAKRLGVPRKTLVYRLEHWPLDRALRQT